MGGLFVLVFGAGALTTTLLRPDTAEAASGHVYELMVYHTLPGKVPALESVFRGSDKLKARYGLKVVGYWVPTEDSAWKNTIIYLIAHPSRQAADENWKAFHADPAFLASRRIAESLIEQAGNDFRVEEVYMRPTDFSAMK